MNGGGRRIVEASREGVERLDRLQTLARPILAVDDKGEKVVKSARV
jgi:hypothetical protein